VRKSGDRSGKPLRLVEPQCAGRAGSENHQLLSGDRSAEFERLRLGDLVCAGAGDHHAGDQITAASQSLPEFATLPLPLISNRRYL
jgi:hypothetical protein